MYCILLPWPSFSLMMLTCLVIYEAKKASLSIRTRRNLKDHFIPSTTRLQTPFFFYFRIFPRTLLMCVFSCSVVSNSLQPYGLWPNRLLCPRDSPGKNTEVSCHALLQGIFPTQGSNPGLPHCRWIIIYHLSHQGSPRILKRVAYPFSRETSRLGNQTGVSCLAGGFFTT